MTQVAESPTPASQNAPPSRPPRNNGRGRWPVVVVLIVALVACGLTRNWASEWKDRTAGPHPVAAERGVLSGMNSYALGLMLGGLRGPLVMVLWSKVENQKLDRDLEDVDTMIDWIRMLQPEFDTVHIFQIWNKAYNISVLMASTASKYTTILDAVDYGRRVLADRPGDINILDSLATVFGEKLGGTNVAERFFYRQQFREDTLTDENGKKAYPQESKTYHRLGIKFLGGKSGPLLDENNNILPQLLAPRSPRPADLPANSEWNDGSELQYLKQYQPFPYGIPPTAMGYNYAKRAQVAMTVGGQKPLQLSETVVDSEPGAFLKQWAEREQERGLDYEARAFGIKTTLDDATAATAPISPTATPADMRSMDAAIYSYALSARLCTDALKEYDRHLADTRYVNPYLSYTSHIDDLKAMQALSTADHAYTAAFAPGADRGKLLAEADAAYHEARARNERILLKYYTEESIAGPLYRNKRIDLDQLGDEALEQLYRQVLAAIATVPPMNREYEDQRGEYGSYIYRADIRLGYLNGHPQPQQSILQNH